MVSQRPKEMSFVLGKLSDCNRVWINAPLCGGEVDRMFGGEREKRVRSSSLWGRVEVGGGNWEGIGLGAGKDEESEEHYINVCMDSWQCGG